MSFILYILSSWKIWSRDLYPQQESLGTRAEAPLQISAIGVAVGAGHPLLRLWGGLSYVNSAAASMTWNIPPVSAIYFKDQLVLDYNYHNHFQYKNNNHSKSNHFNNDKNNKNNNGNDNDN